MVRSVEVAIGFTGGQWESIWVEIDEPVNIALDDEEMSERAEEVAESLAAKGGRAVAFTRVLYIEEPREEDFQD